MTKSIDTISGLFIAGSICQNNQSQEQNPLKQLRMPPSSRSVKILGGIALTQGNLIIRSIHTQVNTFNDRVRLIKIKI